MGDPSSWCASFEQFYGMDYCLRMSMDLERLFNEQFQGSSFRFQKGWILPTVELLKRLRNLGLPLRTKDHILIHLCSPVETMAPGECYFQVGRKLPGRLSLKFTRRQQNGTVVIQPTVLEPNEEILLASNPPLYLDSIREAASHSHSDRILATLILLTTTCVCNRVNAVTFLQRLKEPNMLWWNQSPYRPFAVNQYNPVNQNSSNSQNSRSLPCGPDGQGRQRRSSSLGSVGRTEPEENDETGPPHLPQSTLQDRSVTTDEYTGVLQAVSDLSISRRSSGSSGGRTSLCEDYCGMSSSLSVGTCASPINQSTNQPINQSRRTNYNELHPQPVEEYVGTEEGAAGGGINDSWRSYEIQRASSLLPLPIVEMNNRLGGENKSNQWDSHYGGK